MPASSVHRTARVRAICWWAWLGLLSAGLAADAAAVPWRAWGAELRWGSSLAITAFAGHRAWQQWMARHARSTTTQLGARGPWTALAIGMSLGMLGDASPLWGRSLPRSSSLVVAMILFGCGHLAYWWAVAQAYRAGRSALAPEASHGLPSSRQPARSRLAKMGIGVASGLGVGFLTWWWVVATSTGPLVRPLWGPSLAYSLLLGCTAGSMSGLAAAQVSYIGAAAGAGLFLASDVLLGLAIFREVTFGPLDGIWLTYGSGQMLIHFAWPSPPSAADRPR